MFQHPQPSCLTTDPFQKAGWLDLNLFTGFKKANCNFPTSGC